MSARRNSVVEWLVVAGLLATVLLALWLQPDPARSARADVPATTTAPAAAAAAPASRDFSIVGARVFDGEHDLGEVDVVVRAGRIVAVGKNAAGGSDRSAVDGSGKTLLPGMIDAHVHAWGDAQREMLRFGVTSGFDMHGPEDRLAVLQAAREGMDPIGEADLWAAGYAVTVPGGHGTQYGFAVPTVAADTDIAGFVRARVAEGADYIKLIVEDLSAFDGDTRLPTLTETQVRALVRAAHAEGRIAVAHVSSLASARMAVDAGVDGLMHVFVDREVDQPFLDAARGHAVFVVPTLVVEAGVAGSTEAAALGDDPLIRPFLDVQQQATLAARFGAAQPELFARALDNVRRLHAAGVPILAGSDAPNPGTAHGASLHAELGLLVRAGLSPREALAAATSLPARHFGVAERGRIAPGMRADLLLVEGNPLADIDDTRRIVRVWKNGVPVSREVTAAAEAAEAPPATTLVGDFERDLSAAFGQWQPTTDVRAGGSSQVELRRVEGGGAGSSGALGIRGEVRKDFPFPWAGAAFFPGSEPMRAMDLSARSELVFLTRGDGRRYRVMLLSGPSMQGMPSEQNFVAGPEWKEVRLPLTGFPGGDPARLRALIFAAGQPLGAFEFAIDQVELR